MGLLKSPLYKKLLNIIDRTIEEDPDCGKCQMCPVSEDLFMSLDTADYSKIMLTSKDYISRFHFYCDLYFYTIRKIQKLPEEEKFFTMKYCNNPYKLLEKIFSTNTTNRIQNKI